MSPSGVVFWPMGWFLLALAVVGSFVPIVVLSIVRSHWRASRVQAAVKEAEGQSIKTDVAPKPVVKHSAVAPAAASGSGFGRVHVGVFTQRDRDFSEVDFFAWLDDLYRRVQLDKQGDHPASENALATLRAGRFADAEITQVVPGRLDLKGAYGDELWSNVEVLFTSVVHEGDLPTARKDLLRLRRRERGAWQIQTVSEWNRYEAIPEPVSTPFGDLGPNVLAAVDFDRRWPTFSEGLQLDQLQLRANDLVRAALKGGDLVEGTPLARMAAYDAALLDHHNLERAVEIERIDIRKPVRCSRDATHDLLELQAVVWMKTWLSPRGRPEHGPAEAPQWSCAFTMFRARDSEDWAAYDLRWTCGDDE